MKKAYIVATVCVIVIIVIIFAGLLVMHTIDKKKTKLGFISPLTGWGAYWGLPEEKGIRLAIEDIRKQYGNVADFIIEDSKTTASDAVTAANKLIFVDDVDILYVSFTGPTSGVSPKSKQNKKVLIYGALTSSMIKENEYAFKM